MTRTFRKEVELKKIDMNKHIKQLQIKIKKDTDTIKTLRKNIGDVKIELRKNIPEQAKKKIKCLKNEIKALNKRLGDALHESEEQQWY